MTRTALLGGLACFLIGVGAGAGWMTWRSATARAAQSGPQALSPEPGTARTRYAPLTPYVRQEAPQPTDEASAEPQAETATPGSPRDVLDTNAPRPWWRDNARGGPPWGGDSNRPPWFASADEIRARAQVLRSNFIEHADLNDDQTMRLDVLVAAMNLRLREKADEWKEYATNDVLPRSELRTRVMNDISSVMVLTYDEMDRSLPEGWREAAGPDFNLRALIDPTVMQDLRPVMGRGAGRWRGGEEGQRTGNAATDRGAASGR